MLLGFGKRIKAMLGDATCMFWTFLFPFCFAVLFAVMIPHSSYQNFKPIEIAVTNDGGENYHLVQSLNTAKTSTGEALFQVSICTKVIAQDKLQRGEIEAYIENMDECELFTNGNDSSVLIVKSFLNWYKQTEGKSVLNFQMNYIHEETADPDFNRNAIYFLSLLGVAAFYALHLGVRAATDLEGNLSNVAGRILMAPLSKRYLALQNFMAALVIEMIKNVLLLGWFILTGKLDCVAMLHKFLLVLIVTSIVGLLHGIVIGILVKVNYVTKQRICQGLALVYCLFAGMMFYKIRYSINVNVPFLAVINPANVATDALYQLYFFNNETLYHRDLMILVAMMVILSAVAIYITRRKSYARI